MQLSAFRACQIGAWYDGSLLNGSAAQLYLLLLFAYYVEKLTYAMDILRLQSFLERVRATWGHVK